MYLQSAIQSLFQSSSAALHDREGVEIPQAQSRREYEAIKRYLRAQGSAGELVAIHLPHDYRYLLTILACMEVGLPYVPLRRSWPATRIEQIRQLSGFRLKIDEENIAAVLTTTEDTDLPTFAIPPEAPLYVIYTSGTTGEPKGVVIQRQGYENFLRTIDAEIACGPETRILCVADFTFDMSLIDVALFIAKQCHCFFSQFDGNLFHLAYEIDAYAITSIATVPNNINLMLQDTIFERSSFESLRQLLLGGSRFSYGTYKNVFAKLPWVQMVYNLYGPTEVTVYCHFHKLTGRAEEDTRDANVSIGKLLPGLSCLLVSPTGEPITQPNVPGEMLVGGIQVMREYLGDKPRTEASLLTRDRIVYYRTGDLAYMDDTGNYYITGRNDETVKRRGYRVNLLDIDSYLQKLDAVQDCATIALPDAEVDHRLVSYFILRTTISEAALRGQMADHLVDYQLPDEIIFLANFPLNNSGKICKKTLAQTYRAGRSLAS